MNFKTFLLYASIACGGIGAGAVVLPYLTHSDNTPQALQESGVSGNTQRKGPMPNEASHQGF